MNIVACEPHSVNPVPFGIITYSDAIEERISGLEAELAYYRDAYNTLYQEKKFIDHLFEVAPEKLTTSHKASIHATVRYLREHERDRDDRGYIKMDAWQVARMAGHSYGTVLNHWGETSRELRMREGFEVETDVGRVPIFDRLVVRVPTTDRERYPQGYYLETYMKEREILPHPEQYRAQTPIEWGGKRKNAGRRQCPRCGRMMKAKDHIRKVQREHICLNCGLHAWDEERRVTDEVLVDAPVERPEASNNQLDCCSPAAEIEASKPVLDEVEAPPLLHQVAVCSPEVLTHAPQPPEVLRVLPIWCPWRYEQPEKPRADGKLDKVPYRTYGRSPQRAKTNDPATWSTYDEAVAAVERSRREGWKKPYEGIGWMCNGDFTGIDLDHCRNKETGEIAAWALDLVALFGSYVYITPSGEGLRIVIRAKKPGDRCKWGDTEIYDHKRFFTWTPDHLEGTPEEVEDGQAELTALYQELAPEVPNTLQIFAKSHRATEQSDDEILEKARGAANGAKFIALYDQGNWKSCGYPSQSEADEALCRMLDYWGAGGNVFTIDRLFRKSGLMRPKWDRSVGSGETYGERTINRALGKPERRAS